MNFLRGYVEVLGELSLIDSCNQVSLMQIRSSLRSIKLQVRNVHSTVELSVL